MKNIDAICNGVRKEKEKVSLRFLLLGVALV